ncbi:MAG TPA: class I SAM-dependent methyltransferase [Candidatus Acidoferrum sp.]|jgi:predicted O-methyltransferase YrrM
MNWLLQNLQRRTRYALQNPRYAFRALYRELISADERFLASIVSTGVSVRQMRGFLDEPFRTEPFAACLQNAQLSFHGLFESADLYAKKILNQYAVVRAFRPDVVIETGVANGVSSAYLLLALHLNNRGRLYSVGLNAPDFLPADKSLGWVVPEWLRSRWKVILGDAKEVLPKLLSELDPVDLFIHDSLHTYEHMMWEFRAAFPHLRLGGLLLSDDALWNTAFPEFASEVGARQAQILRGVGFLRKDLA